MGPQRCQSSEKLGIFSAWCNRNDFLSRLLATDDTWLYHYDQQTKQQSMEWRVSNSPRPAPENTECKNSLETFSPASIFWDQEGILPIDYLPKGQTVNSSLLTQLKDILNEKRLEKVTKGILFLHENVPAHQVLATQKKLDYLGFQCLDYPPSCPDLPPSDCHLFPGLKKQLKGRDFLSDAEVIAAEGTWLPGQTSEFFEWLAN